MEEVTPSNNSPVLVMHPLFVSVYECVILFVCVYLCSVGNGTVCGTLRGALDVQ